jgi:hypothetical protein
MTKFNFEYHTFARWIGTILILIALVMAINVVILGVMGLEFTGIVRTTIELLIYGISVYGIGRIVQYIELHYQEMKFFRKHYIQKDDEVAKVLRDKEDKDG